MTFQELVGLVQSGFMDVVLWLTLEATPYWHLVLDGFGSQLDSRKHLNHAFHSTLGCLLLKKVEELI